MAKGNPDPSPATRFKPGKSGNPGGKTSEQISIERANADKAMRLREIALDKLLSKAEEMDVAELMDGNFLKMLKDAEDRGLGAPVQDLRSGDGSMSPPDRIELLPQPLKNDDSPD